MSRIDIKVDFTTKDFSLNEIGDLDTVSYESDLGQQLIKILLTSKEDNTLQPSYGSDLPELIGTAMSQDEFIMQATTSVLSALKILRDIQKNIPNMDARQLLSSVDSINISAIGTTGYKIDVGVTNKAAATIQESIGIGV